MLSASDPRLAAHAHGDMPAWLWSSDGTRILWANPLGFDAFGAQGEAALAEKIFSPADPHRRQIAQLAGRLNPNGAVRMAIKFVYREGSPQAEIARVVEGMMTDSLGPRLYAKLMEQSRRKD